MRRVIGAAIVAIALAVPVSVTTSSPAWASSSVTCGKLYGYATAYQFHLAMCMPQAKILSGFGRDLTTARGPTKYTWTWHEGTTTVVSLTDVKAGTCPTGYGAYTDTGTVTGGTSTYTQVGDSIQLIACRRKAPVYMGALRLASGTMASL